MGFQKKMMSVAIIAGLSQSGLVLAQASSPGAAPALEQITVVAQRVERDLQDVPVAVSALGSAYLEDANIASIDDVAMHVPGLSMGRFNPAQPQIYIRGIGSTDQSASGDPSVGVFVDGVYISRPGAVDLDFFDLERIEVLRGPQGTLYGKNVVGGAIHYVTRPPADQFSSRAQATVGNYGRTDFKGMLEGPLSQNVNGKLTLNHNERNGYATSATTGQDLSDENSTAFRSQLHFMPRDELDVLLSVDHKRARLAGTNRNCVGEQFIFFPWFAPGSPFAASPCSEDPYTSEKTVDGYTDTDVWGMSATVNYDLGWADLASITAYRRSDIDLQDDFSGSDAPLVVRNVDDEARQWTQEFRLTGGDPDRFSWLAGYYYLFADIHRLENNDFSGNDAPLGLPPGLSFNTFYYQDNETTNHALFGQGTWALSDAITLQVGARLGYENKDARVRTEGFDPTGTFLLEPYDVRPDDSWTSFSPMVSFDYRINPDVMAYLSYSEGYKSGGFNGTARDADSALQGFDEERAQQIEAGLKSAWFNNRVRLNLSLFHIDYTDLQVFQLVDGASLVVSNAADATSQGFEAEFWGVIDDNWRIQGSYAYLDASYDAFINQDDQDFSGNRLTRSPRNSYNIGVNYSRMLTDRNNLSVLVDYSYRSRIFFEANNVPFIGDTSLGLINAKANLSFGPNWELSVWGRNLTDETHITNVIDGRGPFDLSQNGSAVMGAPRMYGLTVDYRY